ncbi:MAG TPA: phosphoribosyltransferase, partial [Firmicutes bacterium]|nr:phosphoribosyltransferase [Bacillota bacterium]
DDIWDSGKTAMAVRERIIEVNGLPEVAVLHYKPSKSRFLEVRPDFAAAETDEWIVYPWEPEER